MGNKAQRLLIVTQIVDRTDPFLSFFHGWLAEFAKHFERIEVICLREGEHSLPANVRVHSLGKERSASSRIAYAVRFLSLAWKLRGSYDAVFVHMNQEYILLAGWLWKLLRKRIYLWRNHYAGGFLTDVAAMFCAKVFCTSRFSYTAKYKRTVIMPVGVDTDLFIWGIGTHTPRSILFFSRFTPSKKPDVLLEALDGISKDGFLAAASFYGSALPEDIMYRNNVIARSRALELANVVKFHEGVPHAEAPKIFAAHEIFVNLSSSGTYDKTMFEAAASGCIVLAVSKDFIELAGEEFAVEDSQASLFLKLRQVLGMSDNERVALAKKLYEKVVEGHNLHTLGDRLAAELA